MRLAYAIGGGYIALCLLILCRAAEPAPPPMLPPPHPPHVMILPESRPALDWFDAAKPFCNALEFDVYIRQPAHLPPNTPTGIGEAAACAAIAGHLDNARERLRDAPADARPQALSRFFNIIHPVADAGDDRSAGPMMRLVLEFWPDNFMALYHAGMAEYATGDADDATRHLTRFLELYHADDSFHRQGEQALAKLRQGHR
jgi:hypothetical protein